MDAGPNRGEALLFSDEVQLLDSASQHLRVDLARNVAAVLGTLMLQLFTDTLRVEDSFSLSAFATDPLEAVVGQKLGHLGDLLLVAVPLDRQRRDLLDAVLARRHRKLPVLVLQVRNLRILLRKLFLQRCVHRFKLG